MLASVPSRGGSAKGGMAGLALLVAICLAVARGAFGQNNFYGISEDFATPPAVRDARECDPTTPLRAATRTAGFGGGSPRTPRLVRRD